ncbi:MAG TPA: helix-turn-helix domain-containing protein [Vitreimonas sp.]|uniref:GlxA family transcriptional regulator n=1 Tax=Vitreimonas sp. TaxID=3069702 RepID=UPI002D7184E3|nr:helix-turn-helix domain-containing protein [Vitreimonas sp.]HYD86476.1 helix-turn-helix domain-containing protein [Vitreimonas sp.]
MLDVTVVLLDDGYASTALMPIEIFHSAGALWRELKGEAPEPRFHVTTVSLDGQAVRSPYAGLMMTPQGGLDSVVRTDIVIVPTSGLALDEKLIENSVLLPWLRKHYAAGAYIAGVCMGSAYLAEAGLLDGKRATTHWAVAPDLAQRYPKVLWRPNEFVTEDSRLLCSGGLTAAADVSLYLVEKLCGHEIAVQTAKALLLTMPRACQSGYAMLPLSPPHNDVQVREAERMLQTRFRENIPVDALAESVGVSSRTFLRRFKAATRRLPGAYLQAVRVETAKAMLERERASVQTVASTVGYDDVSFFRAVFKRETGMTPAEYRARFASMNVRQHDEPDRTTV